MVTLAFGVGVFAEGDLLANDHQLVAEKLGNLLAPLEEQLLEKMKPARGGILRPNVPISAKRNFANELRRRLKNGGAATVYRHSPGCGGWI